MPEDVIVDRCLHVPGHCSLDPLVRNPKVHRDCYLAALRAAGYVIEKAS